MPSKLQNACITLHVVVRTQSLDILGSIIFFPFRHAQQEKNISGKIVEA